MKDRAYGKINLALDVFNKRADGYHDIRTIIVPIDFYDELEINIAQKDNYQSDYHYLRFNEANSIVKMINLLKERYNISNQHYVSLKKRIPIQAGLAGGTSDAASVLRIFKKMYNLNLTKEDEIAICTSVGSDVLFNYYNVPSFVEGTGDIITPFKMKHRYFVLLIKPRLGIKTAQAYQTLDLNTCDHPDIDLILERLTNGDSIDGLLLNSLEQPSFVMCPEIKELKESLINKGAKNVLMSGSGSTVFVISKDKSEIDNLYNIYRNKDYFVWFTRTLL